MKLVVATQGRDLFHRAIRGDSSDREIRRIGCVARLILRLEGRRGDASAYLILIPASELSDHQFGVGLIELLQAPIQQHRLQSGRCSLKELLQEWSFMPRWASELGDRDFWQLLQSLYVDGDFSVLQALGGAS